MSKKPVLKSSTKKGKSLVAKKALKKVGKSTKKVITEKERDLRQANLIANSEKKKKTVNKRPKKIVTEKQTLSLLDAIVEGMKERKAKNIAILNLSGLESRVTDYFVICEADSNIHVNSIADSIEDTVEKLSHDKLYHTEGQQNGEWILLDYINVVAHVFLKEMREHYNIEGLWGDAEITHIKD
jgi:ribosome-associated protein